MDARPVMLLDNAGGSVPMDSYVYGAMLRCAKEFRNPSARYANVVMQDIISAKNIIRKCVGATEDDEVIVLSSCSEGIAWAMAQRDNWKCHWNNHHSVFANPKSVECEEPEGYIASSVNAETGVRFDREDMKKAKEQGMFCVLDVSQSIGKEDICFSREYCDVMVFSTSKVGWRSGVIVIRGGVKMEPLIYGAQEEGLRGGTFNYMNYMCTATAIETYEVRHDYNELWLEAKDILGEYGKVIESDFYSTFCIELDMETEILAEELKDRVLFSTGSVCNTGNFDREPFRDALGIDGGIIRLSFGKDTTIEIVKEGCKMIAEVIGR